MTTANMQVRITAELSQIRAGLAQLTDQLDKAKTKGRGVGEGASAGVDGLTRKLGQAGKLVAGFAATIGAGMSIAGLVRASDEASTLAAKLKLATKNARELVIAQRGTFDIAQRTRTSLGATVDLYARIERSTRAIGVNQKTQLQLAETINQAAQISGGGPGAEAALFQLSQGLASGTLRGEELNSVLEQTPRLAQAIADGMNVPIGQLRKMAEEGKLTSEAVLRAVLSQSKALQDEFAQMPQTIGSGFTLIRNAFLQMLQDSPAVQAAVRGIGTAMRWVADNLPAITATLGAIGAAIAVAFAASKWSAFVLFIQGLPALLAKAWAILLANPFAAVAAAVAGLIAYIVLMRNQIKLGVDDTTTLGDLMTSVWRSLGRGAKEFSGVVKSVFAGIRGDAADTANSTTQSTAKGTKAQEAWWMKLVRTVLQVFDMIGAVIRGHMAGVVSVVGKAIETMMGSFNDLANAAKAAFSLNWDGVVGAVGNAGKKWAGFGKEAGTAYGAAMAQSAMDQAEGGLEAWFDRRIKEAQAIGKEGGATADGNIGIPGGGAADGKSGKNKNGEAARTAASLAQTNAELVADAVRRALEELQRLYDEGEIGIKEFFSRKTALELQGVDAAIAAAQAELAAAKGADQVAAANAKIVQLQRDRAEIGPRAAREQAKAEEELTRKLGELKIRMLQAQGEVGEATRLQLEEEFKSLIKRLEAQGDTAGVTLAKKLINTETFKAQLDQAGQTVQDAVSRFQGTETSVGAQVSAGMLGQRDGANRVEDSRAQTLEQLVSMRDQYAEIEQAALAADDAMSAAKARQAMTELNGTIAQLSVNTNSLAYKITNVLQNSLQQLFQDLATGTKTAKEAFMDFVKSFIAGIAQIIAQELALAAVRAILKAMGLGTSGSAGGAHEGGVIGQTGWTFHRTVDMRMFQGAPRYHSGGVAGLKPDEVPAILQRGEEVLTKDDPRHRNNGGMVAGQPNSLRIINVNDPRAGFRDYLESSEGEQVVVNIMGRNGMTSENSRRSY